MVDISKLTVWLPEDKPKVLLPALDKLANEELHARKEITSLLGRFQSLVANLPTPPATLCVGAEDPREMQTWSSSHFPSSSRAWSRLAHVHHSAIASVRNALAAAMLQRQSQEKPLEVGFRTHRTHEVQWFAVEVTKAPWLEALFQRTKTKRRVGALEMLGTLILFILAAKFSPMSVMDMNIPVSTDNEGNAFSASRRSSKRWPCSALLVQLTAQEHGLHSFVSSPM